MGYIFDALKRAKDVGSASREPGPEVSAPAPTPTPVQSPTAHLVGTAADQAAARPLRLTEALASHDDAAHAAGGITAQVIALGEGIDDRVIGISDPSGVPAEEYRAIRTGILARWHHKRNLVHTITSATPQEGKTITSLNLGLSFAELRNRRTIVVEADLRLPQFANLLKLSEHAGLVDVLEDKAQLAQAIVQLEGSNLHLLTAGRRANNNAVQLLSSTSMAKLVKTLRHQFDHVIFDTPPVVELADAGILGALSDDVLMVVRMNRTPRTLVEQAIRTLSSYHAPVGGMIATDQPRSQGRYRSYRYGYRYSDRYVNNQSIKEAA